MFQGMDSSRGKFTLDHMFPKIHFASCTEHAMENLYTRDPERLCRRYRVRGGGGDAGRLGHVQDPRRTVQDPDERAREEEVPPRECACRATLGGR